MMLEATHWSEVPLEASHWSEVTFEAARWLEVTHIVTSDWSDTTRVMVEVAPNQFALCLRVYRPVLHWTRPLVKAPHGYPVLQSSLAAWKEKYPLEGVTELTIKDTVYDGVHRTVHVPKPREYGKDQWGYTSGAERSHDVNREEGCPAEQKHPHDYTEGDGGLVVGHFVDRGADGNARNPTGRGHPSVGADRRRGVLAGQADALDMSTGVQVEPVVDEDHGEAGEVETDGGREGGVERVQFEVADALSEILR